MTTLQPQALRSYLAGHDLMLFAGVPVVYHCHHFNLFLDQTIDDALGSEAGEALRFAAARESAGQLLREVTSAAGAVTPVERLDIAQRLFAAMGHGRLAFAADANGGEARGSTLHYGYSWHEKYGSRVKRRTPADAFAAGYGAAALEVAFASAPSSMQAQETECIAKRDASCFFTFSPGAPARPLPLVGAPECARHSQTVFAGLDEARVEAIAAGLRDFTAGVAGDERGLAQGFGVYVTMHLAGYYNRISYDALAHVERSAPGSVSVLEDLLRESGHVCVFNTFGGILLSPEWESMVGPLTGDPQEIVTGCLAIGRALGFGHWTLAEFVPGQRLVVRTPSTYETPFYATRYGRPTRPSDYFLQGAALAIAQLAHRVDWTTRPQLTEQFYTALFRGGVPWQAEQTQCLTRGDVLSEVVVTALP